MTAEVDTTTPCSSRPTPTASARSRSTGPSGATAGRRIWRTPTTPRSTDAAADPRCAAVVVTGAGTTFCPGADMARLGDLSAEGAGLPHRPVDVPRCVPEAAGRRDQRRVRGRRAGAGAVLPCPLRRRHRPLLHRFRPARPRRRIRDRRDVAPARRARERAGPADLGPHVRRGGGEGARSGEPRRAPRRGAHRGQGLRPRHRGELRALGRRGDRRAGARRRRRHLRRRTRPCLRRNRQAHRLRRPARGHRVVARETTAEVPAAVNREDV